MEKLIIIKPITKNEKCRSIIKKDSHSVVYVKNTKRAVKRVINRYKDSTIVAGKEIDDSVLEEFAVPYCEFSTESALGIIEKVCRDTLKKYDIPLPLADLYLYANPDTAYKFIEKLVGMSRIFTVVTNKPQGEEADRLYFEYGCLIRHADKINKSNPKETLSIFIENSVPIHTVTINVMEEQIINSNVINIGNISVSDDGISDITEWASGLTLYSLLGKVPQENATIDINKTADTIFVLDTK